MFRIRKFILFFKIKTLKLRFKFLFLEPILKEYNHKWVKYATLFSKIKKLKNIFVFVSKIYNPKIDI